MDRITCKFLDKFEAEFELEADESISFEHFVNYVVIDEKVEIRYEIEDFNIGLGNNIGIDGFALVLSGHGIDCSWHGGMD